MPWATIAQLIIQVGWPMAQKIWDLAQSGADATAADWASLTAMANQTAYDRMLAQLKAANIDPASPQGLAFLALTK
jgi:hypothetical protein